MTRERRWTADNIPDQTGRVAIVTGANQRLRPILMTTLTTILGLLPMAIGLGEAAELRTPMAITVIGGLAISTLLTLVVIPVVYDLVDRKQLQGDLPATPPILESGL